MITENSSSVNFPIEFDIHDVCTEIQSWKIDDNKRIRCSHSVILKAGPVVHKVATCLEIVDEHTGELHHYAIEIHHIKKYKKLGWVEHDKYRIDDLDVFESLCSFLNFVKEEKKGIYDKKYLISEQDYEFIEKIKTINNELFSTIFENKDTYEKFLEIGGVELLKDLLQINLKQNNTLHLVKKLKELDLDSLKKLNSLAGLSHLKRIVEIWKSNNENANEEYWQTLFSENSWIISQIFSFPVVCLSGKAYVGGKWINNKGGKITDFIFENNLTKNIILIEIKTPITKILGSEYRQTYSVSSELSGSQNQILTYKHNMCKEYANIIANNPDKPRFENFNPTCLLIMGNFSTEIKDNYRKKEAFEIYRSDSRNIDIVTFDELFNKAEILISLLEGKPD